MNKSELRLGLPVTFTKCYSIDPNQRIGAMAGLQATPIPYCKDFKGIVVGQRNYIMGEWMRWSRGEEGAHITGKRRAMVLVATSLYKMPVLVKIEDAEIDTSTL